MIAVRRGTRPDIPDAVKNISFLFFIGQSHGNLTLCYDLFPKKLDSGRRCHRPRLLLKLETTDDGREEQEATALVAKGSSQLVRTSLHFPKESLDHMVGANRFPVLFGIAQYKVPVLQRIFLHLFIHLLPHQADIEGGDF